VQSVKAGGRLKVDVDVGGDGIDVVFKRRQF
jgi:hypothetical protein